MKTNILAAFLTLIGIVSQAQDIVVVTNSKDGEGVEIKYYCNTVFYDSDINFYRKAQTDSDWTKLNDQPIHWGDYTIPDAVLNTEKETKMLSTVIDSVGIQEMQGVLLLLTMMNSFESTEFSKYLGIQFSNKSATSGTTYTYRVTRLIGNREEEIGISDPISAGSYVPPMPPRDIQININKRKVGFRWLPESRRYYGVNIYRNSTLDDTWVKVVEKPVIISKSTGENGETAYADFFYQEQNLDDGVTYRYKLTALDFFGQESSFSEEFAAPIRDNTPPLPPVIGKASVDHNEMTVNFGWTYPTEEVPDLAGFNIYRITDVDGDFIKLNEQILPAATSGYSDMAKTPESFLYYVSAVDYAGNETPSETIYALVPDIFPPAIPRGLSADGDTTSVILNWQSNTEEDLKGYLVYRIVDNDPKNFVLLNASTILETQYIDQLAGNTKNTYQYYVISVDTAFNKSEPSALASASLPDATPPNKPFIKNISVLEDGLEIHWMPAIDADTEQFQLYRSTNASADTLIASLHANTTSYKDQSVMPDTDYDYYLIALDSAYNSSEISNSYRGVWSTATVKTILGGISASYDSAKKVVQISWQEKSDVNGFILYRKTDNAEFKPITGVITTSSFADENIKKGLLYHYQIRSVGARGINGESNSQSIEIK